jgi:putative aldouronate transport system permease protein
MRIAPTRREQPLKRSRARGFVDEIRKNRTMYLMTLPAISFFLLFSYFPMVGIIVAFKQFRYNLGIFGSAWETPIYKNFLYFITTNEAWRAVKNTLLLNVAFIVVGLILEVGIAIILYELKSRIFVRVAQSTMLLPYFISWIVVSVMAFEIFNFDFGMANGVLSSFGLQRVDWYGESGYWPYIMILVNRWKTTGYGCIIYLAVLSSIDASYYEASALDGASKIQQIRHITLPLLMPSITTLTLLSIGRIMNADFGMFYAIVGENPILYPTVDVLDTFVYRNLRKLGDVGMSSAAGLFQSVIAFILLVASNSLARKYQNDGSIF